MKIELDLLEIQAIINIIEIQTFNPSRFTDRRTLDKLEPVKKKLLIYMKEIERPSVGRKGWKK